MYSFKVGYIPRWTCPEGVLGDEYTMNMTMCSSHNKALQSLVDSSLSVVGEQFSVEEIEDAIQSESALPDTDWFPMVSYSGNLAWVLTVEKVKNDPYSTHVSQKCKGVYTCFGKGQKDLEARVKKMTQKTGLEFTKRWYHAGDSVEYKSAEGFASFLICLRLEAAPER